ncbi:MAG: 4Fe-4S binding protein [Elusimicrobia bacterium]|nr:4Fe-4S binding protein [Elusimicrobiota bacterium]
MNEVRNLMPDKNKRNILPSAVFFILSFVPVFLFSGNVVSKEISPVYALIWSLFAGFTGWAAFFTGRVAGYRRGFFVTMATGFLVHFKFGLISKIFESSCFKGTPYCHIAIATSFFNYLYQQYLALMSGNWKLWAPVSIAFLWIFATLAAGRAFCSWSCFYGGIDDFFSGILKKPVLKLDKIAFAARDFPMALLIFFLLVSFSSMLPSYCLWLCPFKFTGELMDIDPGIKNIQMILMIAAIIFLVMLSFLLKKRAFCSILCPFGAWQAFFGKINPFRIGFDKEKCTECGICFQSCPVYAMDFKKGEKLKILDYCNLCGECVSACPENALNYSVFRIKTKDVESGFGKLLNPESFFILSILIFSGTLGSLFVPAAIHDVMHWLM